MDNCLTLCKRASHRLCSLLLLAVTLTGCQTLAVKDFSVKSLVKSDIDMVTDQHRLVMTQLIKELTIKLYSRNPSELTKNGNHTLEERLAQILAPPPLGGYTELDGKSGIDAIRLALHSSHSSDRVFALSFGIATMIDKAYGHKQEFFFTDKLDHQVLYNSARNLETVAWLLTTTRSKETGAPLLLTNGSDPFGTLNLSFSRVFGKLIATQDMMAMIVADQNNRTIKNVVHKAASFTFLPI